MCLNLIGLARTNHKLNKQGSSNEFSYKVWKIYADSVLKTVGSVLWKLKWNMWTTFVYQNMIWQWVKVQLSIARKGAGRPSGGNQLIGIAQCAKAGAAGRGKRPGHAAAPGASRALRGPRCRHCYGAPPDRGPPAAPANSNAVTETTRRRSRAPCGSCQCWSCDICTNPRKCGRRARPLPSRSLLFFHARASLRHYERHSRTWYMYKNAWYVNSRDERERT